MSILLTFDDLQKFAAFDLIFGFLNLNDLESIFEIKTLSSGSFYPVISIFDLERTHMPMKQYFGFKKRDFGI